MAFAHAGYLLFIGLHTLGGNLYITGALLVAIAVPFPRILVCNDLAESCISMFLQS